MENIYDIVCEFEKVKTHLDSHPEDKGEVIKLVDEIKGDYQDSMLSVMETFMDKTFVKLYDGFNLDLPPDFDLLKTLENYHVVICPNHQSHADYIALQYIFYKEFKLPVYVAAGINLNIFPIGNIFKKCGAFFIRRRFTNYLYKIVFQGYIYYLLKTDKVVEFFFEGGRTRTGKLLPPKFGLFSMILDAHNSFGDTKKPLMFIPVSIAHEHIPEERAHEQELRGAKKVKENPTQLLKLFKLFSKKHGTVHVKFGKGILANECEGDLKGSTQNLAFETFRRVGANMPITPSSLLALTLLDEPTGALTWVQIEERSLAIIDYCEHMDIPLTKSLQGDGTIASLKMAMDMFINNKKVALLKRVKLNQIFYTIKEESRVSLLYHKNMILHHFFVPTVINTTWLNIFSGQIKTQMELTKFLLMKRKELKFEFYLPKTEKMLEEGMKIISYATGKNIVNIEEILSLPSEELYKVATKVKPFSTALSYIYEAYYICAVSLKYLEESVFSEEKFLQISEELFKMEMEHGRVVKYPESYTVAKLITALEYFRNMNIIKRVETKTFQVIEKEKLARLIEKFAKDIGDQTSINTTMKSYYDE